MICFMPFSIQSLPEFLASSIVFSSYPGIEFMMLILDNV